MYMGRKWFSYVLFSGLRIRRHRWVFRFCIHNKYIKYIKSYIILNVCIYTQIYKFLLYICWCDCWFSVVYVFLCRFVGAEIVVAVLLLLMLLMLLLAILFFLCSSSAFASPYSSIFAPHSWDELKNPPFTKFVWRRQCAANRSCSVSTRHFGLSLFFFFFYLFFFLRFFPGSALFFRTQRLFSLYFFLVHNLKHFQRWR